MNQTLQERGFFLLKYLCRWPCPGMRSSYRCTLCERLIASGFCTLRPQIRASSALQFFLVTLQVWCFRLINQRSIWAALGVITVSCTSVRDIKPMVPPNKVHSPWPAPVVQPSCYKYDDFQYMRPFKPHGINKYVNDLSFAWTWDILNYSWIPMGPKEGWVYLPGAHLTYLSGTWWSMGRIPDRGFVIPGRVLLSLFSPFLSRIHSVSHSSQHKKSLTS